ncbi:MAG TPA: polyamine ABC transporter substrate-binding protein [Steroidobacteraceae bacterium]|nr:polyamine ABC transporter substrate-binding protein [Steroidobacteraceae bacterium]
MTARVVGGLAAIAMLAACGDGTGATSGAADAAEEKVLHVYNWVDYIGPTTIADFEAKTGIQVVYDTYDSNELLETKMLTGRSGYDVVFPSAVPLARQVGAGSMRKLDKSKLPNLAHMDPFAMGHVARNDPGNDHAINYTWGTAGLGYNPAMVARVLGTDRIDSWAAIFDPAVASKLAKCGIAMIDVPEDTLMIARIYLGLDPNSQKLEDLAAAEALLKEARPYIRYFNTSQLVNDLASGEVCVGFSWNGYILQARDRGAAAATPVKIEYAVPREGSFIWFDTVAIPADAPHPDNAHAFLNYLMEPEVIAKVSNHIGYANGNLASLPFLEARVRDDPAVYPAEETRLKLQPDTAESPSYIREASRAWTRIKTGQ